MAYDARLGRKIDILGKDEVELRIKKSEISFAPRPWRKRRQKSQVRRPPLCGNLYSGNTFAELAGA